MRTILTILYATLLASCIQEPNDISQPDISEVGGTYMWNDGKKIELYSTQKNYKIYQTSNEQELQARKEQYKTIECYCGTKPLTYGIVIDSVELEAALSALDEEMYSIPVYADKNNNEFIITELVFVNLQSIEDYAKLEAYSAKYNTKIINNKNSSSLLHRVVCDKNSTVNALELANILHDTLIFDYVEVALSLKWELFSESIYNSKQWGLYNHGQTVYDQNNYAVCNGIEGIDIGFHAIKNLIPLASEIVVAVIDSGVNFNHPDLANRLHSYWNATTQSVDNTIYGYHGTACAGVISARPYNNIGIYGISPAKIMGINVDFNDASSSNFQYTLANAVQYAVEHGADVINCSWGISGTNYTSTPIKNQIINAVNNGRNGKGCVVVCSSGNDNVGYVYFPASADERVLSVGAINPTGVRAVPQYQGYGWGSNYGTALDIVAPGSHIYTTSTTNYTVFSGTSAACPFVSGVAAALLAIDPTLTQPEVNNIIEQTTLKVGSGYSQYANRPNGSWSAEYGYGLVRLDNAISYTFPSQTINDTTINQDTTYRGSNVTFNNVTVNSAQVDILSVFNHVGLNSVTLSADSDTNISSHTTININGMTMTGDSHLLSNSTLTTSINGITMRNSSNAEFCATSFTINPGVDIASGSQLQLTIN